MRASLLLLMLSACIDSSAPTGSADSITLFPTTVYTGADESATRYAVPIAASGASGMSWLSSDPALAGVTGTDRSATVTALKEGAITITAKAGSESASAMVIVTHYSAAQRMAGAQSYTKLACAGCHASASDITPSGVGKHTDAQLLAAVTQGANPEGGDISIGKANHSFAADPGIVAYLRSLAPEGIPHDDN